MTQWRPIAGFEGLYEVSDDGRVRVLVGAGRGRSKAGLVLKPDARNNAVLLYARGGAPRVKRKVHHLVLEAFVGPRAPGALGRHLDGDRTNNRVSNLAWGDASDAAQDRIRNGRHFQASKTHCKHGHPLSGDNLIHSRWGRRCRECNRRRNAERKRRQRSDMTDDLPRTLVPPVTTPGPCETL